MSEGKSVGWMIAAVAAFIVIMLLIFNAQAEACADKGGHQVHVYKSNICVSEDGRILE